MKIKWGFFRKDTSRLKTTRSRRRGLVVEMLEDRRLLCSNAAPAVTGEPTICEQYMLELINLARADGGAEATRDGLPGLQEGPPTVNGEAWTIQNTVQPLAWNTSLKNAASGQATALNNADHLYITPPVDPHTFGGKTPQERISDAGYISGPYTGPTVTGGYRPGGENIAESARGPKTGYSDAELSTEVLDQHRALFKDLSVPGRGHRNTMMLAAFKEIGIGMSVGEDNSISPGNPPTDRDSNYIVQEYGIPAGGVSFLTGVVYNDTDNSLGNAAFPLGFTPGEEIGGATITATPVGGGIPNITTAFASGGYSLQLTNGTYNVTTTGPYGTTAPVMVTISGSNVKQDFVDPVGVSKIGVHRGRQFFLDVNGSGAWDSVGGGDALFMFGIPGDEPIVGDWDGDGTDDIGVHRGQQFYLDANGNGSWNGVAGGDTLFMFGRATGDVAVIGDWNGDGADDIGVHRGQQFYLDTNGNGAWNGVAGGDTLYVFGRATGDVAVSGDWNGGGNDKIGVHRGNQFYLDTNGNGAWNGVAGGDSLYRFGRTSGDEAVSGDWSGDGTDKIGVHRGNQFYLDTSGNGAWNGVAGGDSLYLFGRATGDTGIAGNWKPAAPPLLAAGGAVAPSDRARALTEDDVAPIVQQAIGLWSAIGLSGQQRQSLGELTVQIADLPGARLGEASGTTITLDAHAAGYGWFIDRPPTDDADVLATSRLGPSDPQLQMDLLTAVMHELGHVLGYGHDDDFDAMFETLAMGVRRSL